MAKLGKHVAAIVIMGAIIAVLFVLCTPRTASPSSEVRGATGVGLPVVIGISSG
jgi:cytochrome c oxidase assembly factor CtaG